MLTLYVTQRDQIFLDKVELRKPDRKQGRQRKLFVDIFGSVSYVKAGQHSSVAFAHGTLQDLAAGLSSRAVEPFFVTLEPIAGSGTNPIVHTGHEFVCCLTGRIVYTIEDRAFLLEPGDSLLFESRLPHRWQNVDVRPSQALLLLYPADARDRPTERHFEPSR